MKLLFSQKLNDLAKSLPVPLYAVGGIVRNSLLFTNCDNTDVDICAPLEVETFIDLAKRQGFTIENKFSNMTAVISDGEKTYEYAQFRKECYDEKSHKPTKVEFTDDINLDAVRRDFKCNALYYDIIKNELVDVLGGKKDIENRVIDTVTDSDKVLSVDGERILRLIRFSGELNLFLQKK